MGRTRMEVEVAEGGSAADRTGRETQNTAAAARQDHWEDTDDNLSVMTRAGKLGPQERSGGNL